MFPLKAIAAIIREDTGSKIFFVGIQVALTALG